MNLKSSSLGFFRDRNRRDLAVLFWLAGTVFFLVNGLHAYNLLVFMLIFSTSIDSSIQRSQSALQVVHFVPISHMGNLRHREVNLHYRSVAEEGTESGLLITSSELF